MVARTRRKREDNHPAFDFRTEFAELAAGEFGVQIPVTRSKREKRVFTPSFSFWSK